MILKPFTEVECENAEEEILALGAAKIMLTYHVRYDLYCLNKCDD
jgi:hypothetical protein